MSQYSIRDMLRIHGDGITRPGTPVKTQDVVPPPKQKTKPTPMAKKIPYAEMLCQIHAIGEHWAKQPYVPENFHKALEQALEVVGGKFGVSELKGVGRGYQSIRESAADQQVKEDE